VEGTLGTERPGRGYKGGYVGTPNVSPSGLSIMGTIQGGGGIIPGGGVGTTVLTNDSVGGGGGGTLSGIKPSSW